MIYQITANLYFTTQDPIDDIKDKIVDHFPDAIVLNPGTPEQECSYYQLDECYHDEQPLRPHVLIERHDNCPP